MIGRLISPSVSKFIEYRSNSTNLVKQQHMGLLQRQHWKCYSGLLPTTQRPDQLQPCHPTNLEISKVLPIILFTFTWKLRCQKLNRCHGGYQSVNVVLREISAICIHHKSTTRLKKWGKLTREVVHCDSRILPADWDPPWGFWFCH